MAANSTSDTAEMPIMHERVVRPNEDEYRNSDETEGKRPLRSSQQPNPRSNIAPQPSLERASYDSPSGQQLTHWQPQHRPHFGGASMSGRPHQPSFYGHSTSNDYTVYDGSAGIIPPNMGPNNTPTPTNPYPGSEIYFQPIWRGFGNQATTDLPSAVPSREPSMMNRPNRSTMPMPQKSQWQDDYDRNMDGYDDAPSPPPKVTPRKRTNIYVVREGGEGGDGGDGRSPPPEEVLRLPFTGFMAGTVKGHFIAVLGEFVGTTMFLFFAFAGTIVANVGARESSQNTTTNATVGFSPIVNLYVAVSFGFSLMVNVWIFFRVSGGLFNPAVTLGMVMTKAITYVRGFLLVGAQVGGAIFASFLVQVLFPVEFNVRTTLSGSTTIVRGIFIEAILTAELVFTVFMLAKEKHKATYMAPVGIGLALFVAELVGVFFTGGSLNPARSLGPCVTTGQFDSDHWVYWVGPAIGAIAAFVFYRFIKILEYEVANPGQDNTAEEEEEKNEQRGEV